MARPIGHGGVVGQFAAAVFTHPRDGSSRIRPKAKGLRRLHGAERGALGGGDNPRVFRDLLDGVGDDDAGDAGACSRAASSARRDRAGTDEGTGSRHELGQARRAPGAGLGQGFESVGADAVLPRCAAE